VSKRARQQESKRAREQESKRAREQESKRARHKDGKTAKQQNGKSEKSGFFSLYRIIRIRKRMNRSIGKGQSSIPHLRDRESSKIAEMAYVMDPITDVDRKITENRAAISPFPIIFALKNRNNGSQFRYFQECNEIRDNRGIQFLYL
jgi:hypothetical protein